MPLASAARCTVCAASHAARAGLPGAVRVTEGAVDGDRRVPGVDLVARGVAGERRRDAVDVVGGELAEGVGELRQIHDPHSRHKPATSWGIFGSDRQSRERRVSAGQRRSGSLGLTAHQTVEDVGLADTSISSKPSTRRIADEHDRAADDHVDPARLEARVVRALRRPRLGRERAEHVLGRGAREPEVVDLLAVVLGEAQLDRGDGGDGARRARRASPPRPRRGSRAATSATRSRTDRDRVRQLLGRGRVGVRGTAR